MSERHKETWQFVQSRKERAIVSEVQRILVWPLEDGHGLLNDEEAARIVQDHNACAGIPDPAAEFADLRERVAHLEQVAGKVRQLQEVSSELKNYNYKHDQELAVRVRDAAEAECGKVFRHDHAASLCATRIRNLDLGPLIKGAGNE